MGRKRAELMKVTERETGKEKKGAIVEGVSLDLQNPLRLQFQDKVTLTHLLPDEPLFFSFNIGNENWRCPLTVTKPLQNI